MEIQDHAEYIHKIIKQTAVLDQGLRYVGFNTALYTGITPPPHIIRLPPRGIHLQILHIDPQQSSLWVSVLRPSLIR